MSPTPSGLIPIGALITDRVKPTVAMTSPVNQSTVSGVINVTAAASDNDQVASVQLRQDGANLGAPITVAPYTRAVDTMALAQGNHQFDAVAVDRRGNVQTAGLTIVTVNNVPANPPNTIGPPGGGSTAIDQGWIREGAFGAFFPYGVWVAKGYKLQYRFHVAYQADQKPPIFCAYFSPDAATEYAGVQWNTGQAGASYELWSGWYDVTASGVPAGSAQVCAKVRWANESGGNPQWTDCYQCDLEYQWVVGAASTKDEPKPSPKKRVPSATKTTTRRRKS